MTAVTVRVPATTANLGPGFDCLGMALDLWNRTHFSLEGNEIRVIVEGEGRDHLPQNHENLIAQAALRLYAAAGAQPPDGLLIRAENHIPLGSGLGSSSAAVLAGLLGANALLGEPLDRQQILELAAEIEGHPDNAAPALFGGLVVSARIAAEDSANQPGQVLAHLVETPPWPVVVALPAFELSTRAARAALPETVPLSSAVYNLSRVTLVVEALRLGDAQLLDVAMQDCLHQPARLKLIPGAAQALLAARQAGACAAALSGAGPSVIAFAPVEIHESVANAMSGAFLAAGLAARTFSLVSSPAGASVEPG